VFAVTARESTNPVRTYRRLAFVVLLISFVPDVILATTSRTGDRLVAAGENLYGHARVAWFTTVTMLTRLTSFSVPTCEPKLRTHRSAASAARPRTDRA
jgi:hypothetical protein